MYFFFRQYAIIPSKMITTGIVIPMMIGSFDEEVVVVDYVCMGVYRLIVSF